MRTRLLRVTTAAAHPWLLALLAPALILGIVAMHTLLAQSPQSLSGAMRSTVTTSMTAGHDPHAAPTAQAVVDPDDGGHGHEGSMPDCGGLMAMCLALLVTVIAYVATRHRALLRVLWQRPPPTLVRLGAVRAAFEQLTPLQRTTVIRC